MVNHLESNNLTRQEQHGFVSGRSCVTQLLDCLDSWTQILDSGGSVDCVYMDFMKAFDSVPHQRLIAKTGAHGITGNVLGWIKDFLSNRTQRVVINGVQSEQAQVTSGIPQGSVLGPLLFVIYINDLPHVTKCPTRLFADDTKVFARSDLDNNTEKLQEDLDNLQAWSEKWLLKFHPEKCHVLKLVHTKSDCTYHMSRKDQDGNISLIPLSESEFEKDLGVYIDNKTEFQGAYCSSDKESKPSCGRH